MKASFQRIRKKRKPISFGNRFLDLRVEDGIPILHFHKFLYTFEYQFNTSLEFFKFWRKMVFFSAEW